MITREADYAIRTVLYLAQHRNEGAIATTEISEKMQIPYRFLRKISHQLVESGILATVRGKQGGIFLARKPVDISLLDVLEIFDQRAIYLNVCCQDPEACTRSQKCPVHTRLELLQKNLRAEFAACNFAELTTGKKISPA
jgi:Rrf2 family protein